MTTNREKLPTHALALAERYEEALKVIRDVAEHPENHSELVRNNKLHVYMWQLANDALLGKSLPIGS